VGSLMALAVFGVEEPLIADRALVRPLRALEVSLLMTSASLSTSAEGTGLEKHT
jgi:hypothetical protein